MCLVKTPKVPKSDANQKPKPLPVLTNPILDGIDPATRSLRVGRSSLRIRRTAPETTRTAPNTMGSPGLRISNRGR